MCENTLAFITQLLYILFYSIYRFLTEVTLQFINVTSSQLVPHTQYNTGRIVSTDMRHCVQEGLILNATLLRMVNFTELIIC